MAEGLARPRYLGGSVADTHGLLRPALANALSGVDRIIQAGDVGGEDVLEGLQAIAPVTAVRGNMDRERWAARLRHSEAIEIGEVVLYVLHDLAQLDLDPAAAGFAAVISGHTHQRELVERDGILYVNPSSAGRQRAGLRAAAALMEVKGKRLEAWFV